MVPTLAGDNAFAGSNTFNESLNENTDVNIDNTNANQGNISPGLRFGSASGEGIASQRNKGANQYGLDFYTGYSPRMQIAAGGQVGVGIVPTGTGRFEVADGYFDFDDDPTGVKVTVSGSDESAAILGNNSEYSTLVLYNAYTAAKPVGSFFEAFGDNGLCGIDVYSNLDCDGTIYAASLSVSTSSSI